MLRISCITVYISVVSFPASSERLIVMAQPTPEQSLARATFEGYANSRLLLIAALLACLGGCSSHSQATTKDLLIVVPGAGGYGPAYSGMVKGLQAGGIDESEGIRTFKWGSHLFVLNLQDP